MTSSLHRAQLQSSVLRESQLLNIAYHQKIVIGRLQLEFVPIFILYETQVPCQTKKSTVKLLMFSLLHKTIDCFVLSLIFEVLVSQVSCIMVSQKKSKCPILYFCGYIRVNCTKLVHVLSARCTSDQRLLRKIKSNKALCMKNWNHQENALSVKISLCFSLECVLKFSLSAHKKVKF